MDTIVMRPRRVGEILDAAVKLYVGRAKMFMGLAAVVVIPTQLLAGVILLSTVPAASDVPGGAYALTRPRPAADGAAALGAEALLIFTELIVSSLVTAACVKAVSDTYLDQPTDIGTSLRFALRRLPAVLGTELLTVLGVIAGLIALIVPGIWLYCAWSVAIPALMIEGVGPVRSLGRSRRLIRGRWWAAAGVLIVATVMTSVIAGALQAALVGIESIPSSPGLVLAVAAATLSGMVSGIVVQPFHAAVSTVLYYDLRVRREGYDLQLLADQLGLPALAAAPAPEAGTEPWPGRGAEGDPGGTAPGDGPWPIGPESVGTPGGPPFWPPPPGWRPGG